MNFGPRLAIGLVSFACAVFFLWVALTGVRRGPHVWILVGLSVFFGFVTLACLHEASRPLTLRVISGTLLGAGILLTVASLLAGEFLRACACYLSWFWIEMALWEVLRKGYFGPDLPADEEDGWDDVDAGRGEKG